MDILLGSPLSPTAQGALSEIGFVHILPLDSAERDTCLAEYGARIRCLIWSPFTGPLPPALVAKLPSLDHIATVGAGYEQIDVADAAARGICVTNTPRAVTDDTADAAFYLVLAAMRRFPAAERYLRAGKWAEAPYGRASSLTGKTLGVVGYGRIGQAIARRAEAFGLRVIYYGRNRKHDAPHAWHPTIVDAARHSDVLVSVLPGGDATRGLIGRDVFEALGPTGVFVNVGRGTVVDEPALVAALQDGTIAGAGLDVFANEPYVPPELIGLENVVLLPHVGGATDAVMGAVMRDLVENVRAFSRGEAPPDLVPETPWHGRRGAA